MSASAIDEGDRVAGSSLPRPPTGVPRRARRPPRRPLQGGHDADGPDERWQGPGPTRPFRWNACAPSGH